MPNANTPKYGFQESLVIDGQVFLASHKPHARNADDIITDWIRWQDRIFIQGENLRTIIEKNNLGVFDETQIPESRQTLKTLLGDHLFEQANGKIKDLKDPFLAKDKLHNKEKLIDYLIQNINQVNLMHPLYSSMCSHVNTSSTHSLPAKNLQEATINLFTQGDKLIIHEQEIIKHLLVLDKDTHEIDQYNGSAEKILAANTTQYTIAINSEKKAVIESCTASVLCHDTEILNILLKKHRLMQYVDSFIRQNSTAEKQSFNLLTREYPEINAEVQLSPKPKTFPKFFSKVINQSEASEKIMKYLRLEYPGYAKELFDNINQYAHGEKMLSRALHVLTVLKEPKLANAALEKYLGKNSSKPTI